ncbi:hypothetical protein [Enterovirga sp.]|uniref:hypothetical protein n=1 Tax=Enterovirga sp. TaxID=2026350 RepID=UPI002C2ABFE3|nr:hypothetical protein [Enterovirga sp.]HMO29704.1 hypothetical protein [Enterovirga sp.]
MKSSLFLALVGVAAATLAARAAPLSAAGLAAAAQDARLVEIDPFGTGYGEETVGTWLAALTRDAARSISWSGGRCRLVRPEVARDAGGSGARCGHATIHLKRPKDSGDVPLVEVYFDKPQAGAKAAPYAFRGLVRLPDGESYARFTREFEDAWRERFPPPAR